MRGRRLDISSVGALTPSLNAAYCASKAAVVALKVHGLEMAPRGVTCNAVCPGAVVTEGVAARLRDPAERARAEAKSRIGYLAGPADIAPGVVCLASDEARYVTGSVLVIDGGWTLG